MQVLLLIAHTTRTTQQISLGSHCGCSIAHQLAGQLEPAGWMAGYNQLVTIQIVQSSISIVNICRAPLHLVYLCFELRMQIKNRVNRTLYCNFPRYSLEDVALGTSNSLTSTSSSFSTRKSSSSS